MSIKANNIFVPPISTPNITEDEAMELLIFFHERTCLRVPNPDQKQQVKLQKYIRKFGVKLPRKTVKRKKLVLKQVYLLQAEGRANTAAAGLPGT